MLLVVHFQQHKRIVLLHVYLKIDDVNDDDSNDDDGDVDYDDNNIDDFIGCLLNAMLYLNFRYAYPVPFHTPFIDRPIKILLSLLLYL